MSDKQVHRTLDRLAHEIIERNRGGENLVVVGIERAGAFVSDKLVASINRISGVQLTASSLDITRFRDDTPYGEGTSDLPDMEDRDVILVDDVLFTGRTARAALDAVVRSGRPRTIQLLVLIDRGHREYPIQPDYVGRIMPTKHRERVEVNTEEWAVDVIE